MQLDSKYLLLLNKLQHLYTKIIAQTGDYGLDGVKLMIKKGYLEEPPKAPDRDALAKV
jgi:hypothetical protein